MCQLGTFLGIIGRYHWIARRETPFFPEERRREVMFRTKMPFERLKALPVFEAYYEVGRDGSVDRNCWLQATLHPRHIFGVWKAGKGAMNAGN